MKNQNFIFLMSCVVLLFVGCTVEDFGPQKMLKGELNSDVIDVNVQANSGATQISGIGYFPNIGECEGGDYSILMTGDLVGCLLIYVESYDCSPSGTYRESGIENFIGTYNGESGSFWTSYKFSGRYEGCSEDGLPLGAEIFGRCQHPITEGSGEGVFEGVSGRLDFKDNVDTGEFPYRGHLKF